MNNALLLENRVIFNKKSAAKCNFYDVHLSSIMLSKAILGIVEFCFELS